jgi:hypothetical protein
MMGVRAQYFEMTNDGRVAHRIILKWIVAQGAPKHTFHTLVTPI